MIKDLSFVLNKHDKIAIIGEEGNGKSTILKVLINDPSLVDYVSFSGQINTNDELIGYLPQHLDDEWLEITASDFLLKQKIDEKIEINDYNKLADMIIIAAKLDLDLNMITDGRSLKVLSGGELIKLQLIKILHQKPDILLLDEPTNDLDLDTLIWLQKFIKESECPILFVSHDETLLTNVTNGILHIEQLNKKTVAQYHFEHLDYASYINKRREVLTKMTMLAKKEQAEHKIKMEKWHRIFARVDNDINSVSRQDPHKAKMLKRKMHAIKASKKRLDNTELRKIPDPEEAIDLYFPKIDLANKKIILDLNIDNLMIDNRILASGINLSVRGSEHVVIVGNNGVGKTTLIKEITNDLDQRSINYGYMPQDYRLAMNDEQSILSYFEVVGDKDQTSTIRSYLGSLKFTPMEVEGKIKELSGGQKTKLALLKLVYQAPSVLILDEPTRNLSPLSNPIIRKLLHDYQGCIIAVSHDRKFIQEVANTIYELTNKGLRRIYDIIK
ncbi:MAG: ATP-binding cassette domain-containing protein [Erysipelotrichaceae bacterium]|nr:ATP-binding cassette domain-containing protein [Erysipelotrichaceae bacterium]